MGITNRIKELRKALGLTQTDFANKLGLTLRGVQKWEQGSVELRESSLKLIEQTFNVNPSWLRNDEGEIFLTKTAKHSTRDILIISALESGFVSEEDKDFILKYIQEKKELTEFRTKNKNLKKEGTTDN